MGLKDKLKKIKESRVMKVFEASESEKTGVLNGLLLLSAAIGTLMSLQKAANATSTPTACTDTVNQKVEQTDILPNDAGLDSRSWSNHCWWNWWSWWAFGAGP